MYRLPEGEKNTESSKEYIEAWESLAEPLVKNSDLTLMGFNPGFQFHDDVENKTVEMSVGLVKSLGQQLSVAKAKTASIEAMEALLYYGMVHEVKGVDLSSGSHKEWMDRIREMLDGKEIPLIDKFANYPDIPINQWEHWDKVAIDHMTRNEDEDLFEITKRLEERLDYYSDRWQHVYFFVADQMLKGIRQRYEEIEKRREKI